MKNKALIEQIVAFTQKAQSSFTGMQVHIGLELSTAGNNYGRHFSASASFGFKLSHFVIGFSEKHHPPYCLNRKIVKP